MIIKPMSLLAEVKKIYDHGVGKGFATGWPKLDHHFTVKPGEFTVVTGMPSHGKSEWLDALCVNLAIQHNFRIAVFSPENHPLQLHVSKILEKINGQPFWGIDRMDEDTMKEGLEFMDKHFAFIKPDENRFTPMHIMEIGAPWLDQSISQPRAMVIDPYNEMDHYRLAGLTETEYISRILTELRRATREFNFHLFLVAHPTKMAKGNDGKYPVPKLYDIAGSAHFYNKCDNGISIWRDIDDNSQPTEVHVQKVRFRTTGNIGMVELKYDHRTSRYSEAGGYHSTGKNYVVGIN